MWVYLKSRDENLFTVGFYSPDGEWHATTDYSEESHAQEQVHYLNGGDVPV